MVNMKIEKYITQCYSSVRSKSKRRGDLMPSFTKNELRDWLFKNDLREKWIDYIESNYDKNTKPSIDRIDDYGVYEFSNMQLITWRENMIKGVNGKKHHSNCRGISKNVYIWNKSGELIKHCKSHREASIFLNCHMVSVSRAVIGERKTLKKYILTNQELKINQ